MSKIRGLNDIKGHDDDNSHSDDEKGANKSNTYYAGGGADGGSGINVKAPKQDKPKDGDVVRGIFEAAKSHGAVNKYDEEQVKDPKFMGKGQTLTGQAIDGAAPAPRLQRRVLTFYKDAFTIDEGEPRYYTDPANKEFLEQVNQGRVPSELEEAIGNGEDIDVELLDKKEQMWTQQPKKFKAFADQGHSLSSPSASTVAALTATKPRLIALDASKPSTSIQVRCHDGSRLVVKINLTHTVGDLRAHIEASKPSGKPFELRTIAPAALLSDDSQSVADAKLQNAAVQQRIV